MIDDKTPLGWPLPHPGNDPFAVDVPRLRDALTQIDAAISAVRDDLEALPGTIAVDGKIQAAIDALRGGAPATLDTLNELAAALGDDQNFAAAIAEQIGDLSTQLGAAISTLDKMAPRASPTFTGAPKAPSPALDAVQNELAVAGWVKSLLANGALYGSDWTVPTSAFGDSDSSIASTAFVQSAALAATTAVGQQVRLNALLIAELRGDRLNMVDGIVDPYTDASDIAGTSANIVLGGGMIRPRIAGVGGNIASTANTTALAMMGGTFSNVFDNNPSTSISMRRLSSYFMRDAGAGNKALIGEVSIRNENGSRTPSMLFVEVSDDAISWTSIGSFALNQTGGALNTFTTLVNDRRRYVRVYASGDIVGDQDWGVAELVIREGVRTAMSLLSAPFASDIASPKTARLAVQVAPMLEGAALQVNADLVSSVSRDGGTTWTAVPLQAVETLADGTTLFEGMADISAQPAGSSMVYRHVTANAKDVRLSGTVFQWRV